MKFKLLMYLGLLSCFLHEFAFGMMSRSLVRPTVQPKYKEYTNSSSPDYIEPQLSPSIINTSNIKASQKSQYDSIVADSLSQSAEDQNVHQNDSSAGQSKSASTAAPQGYFSLYDRVFGGVKFKPSEKSQSAVVNKSESQVVKSSPSSFDILLNKSRGLTMQEAFLEPAVGENSSEGVAPVRQNDGSRDVAVFSRLNEVDRANALRMKKFIDTMRIDSVDNPQYKAKLQEWFAGNLPEDITFDVLKKASSESVQSGKRNDQNQAAGLQGVVGSARTINQLLSPQRASKQRSVEQENKQSQQVPVTLEQVQNKVLEDAVSQAFSTQNPKDPLVSLTLPDKARSLAQQNLTKYFEDIARNQFAVQRPSLIASYKNENAQALNKLASKKGQTAVDARINRVMYEKLTGKLNQVAFETQANVEAVGVQAKQLATQKLKDSKNKLVVSVARSENDVIVSKVRNEAQQAEVQRLKNLALKDFKRDVPLRNEIVSDYQDEYFVKNNKLPEQKDINKALEDYFNVTIMSQVKKDNQGVIKQASEDAVVAWQLKQQKQASRLSKNNSRSAASPVTVATVL